MSGWRVRRHGLGHEEEEDEILLFKKLLFSQRIFSKDLSASGATKLLL